MEMKSNIHHTPLRLSSIPSIGTDAQGRTIHGYQNRTDLHYVDGWRDYVEPVYNILFEKLGELIYDEKADVVTHEVLAKSAEELAAEKRALAPFSITPTQGRIALKKAGLLQTVNALIEAAGDDALAIYWEYSLSWERDNAYIEMLGAQIGLDAEGLDQFFIDAAANG